jgi:hypothetical protein
LRASPLPVVASKNLRRAPRENRKCRVAQPLLPQQYLRCRRVPSRQRVPEKCRAAERCPAAAQRSSERYRTLYDVPATGVLPEWLFVHTGSFSFFTFCVLGF